MAARVRNALAWSNKLPASAFPAILRPANSEDGFAPIDFTEISVRLVNFSVRQHVPC